MNIYVANIPFKASEADLKELFEQHGEVTSAKIVIDKLTNRSRGFGFVEMADGTAAKEAIDKLNGSDFEGKTLVVNEARPKTDSASGGSYGSRGGGSGYGSRGVGNFTKRW
jgi:RNA recognition motif-containing protein